MAVQPDTVTGTLTTTSGSVNFTTSGTQMLTRGHFPGDRFLVNGLILQIDTITGENAGTLTSIPPAGAVVSGFPVRLRYQSDGSRVAAQTRNLIDLLGNGTLQALAGLDGTGGNKVPVFTGSGAMSVRTFAQLAGDIGAMVGSNNLSEVVNKRIALDTIMTRGTTVASATTVNLTATTGYFVNVSGTANTTAVTMTDGTMRIVRATGAWTLTAGSSLVLNIGSATSYTCSANDIIIFVRDNTVTRGMIIPVSGKSPGALVVNDLPNNIPFSKLVAMQVSDLPNNIPYSKLVNIASPSIVGRATSGTGSTEILTPAQAWSVLGIAPVANAYSRSTILGTVSQASGVPTGAIIERGSNANGEYVRFADGTQICFCMSTTYNQNVAAGSLWRTDIVFLTYPVAFIANPWASVFVFKTNGAGETWAVGGGDGNRIPGLTELAALAFGNQSSAVVRVQATLFGRWY